MKKTNRPLIVAEAGSNHEGQLSVALELLERAKESGADLVKFQAGNAEGFARTQADFQFYKKYELGKKGYDALVKRGKELGIPVFFSVWSEDFAYLRRLPWFKIAARQISHKAIHDYGHPQCFVSIPHTIGDSSLLSLGLTGSNSIPLHCVTMYPTTDAILWRIGHLRELLKIDVGYSDHTIGIKACVEAARMRNAVAVEKHFTLSHDFGPLRDHQLSATPKELSEMVERIKDGW